MSFFFFSRHVHHMPHALGGKKRESDTLELELEMLVCHYVGAGN